MALQDLTPQLRTRLSRAERGVGIFVSLATLLLLAAFAWYVYSAAQRKGWLVVKVPYFTYVESAAGLKVGDTVILMGFPAGEVTKIIPEDPSSPFNVYIEFVIRDPDFGYLWNDSKVKVTAADFLGSRRLEVTKGGTSSSTNLYATYTRSTKLSYAEKTPAADASGRSAPNLIPNRDGKLLVWVDPDPQLGETKGYYVRFVPGVTKPYWLFADESPALTERLEKVILQVERALPGVFSLTNQVAAVLNHSTNLIGHLDQSVALLQPALSNVSQITTQLREPNGSLGQWLIPTNLNAQIQTTLGAAQGTLVTAQTNLNQLTLSLNQTLENLAAITGNLNTQVQANSLMLTELSSLVINTDDLVQGLKRHWLLKGAFGNPTNPPLPSLLQPGFGGPP